WKRRNLTHVRKKVEARLAYLALLPHDDPYRPIIQEGFDRLRRKLTGYKLQALAVYLTRN
ncbi:MAG: hypothetical protein IJG69_01010, partial [Spirochaetales bacterium]|nr:hypothetical protein [Spirochaetales bacterium]